MFNQAQPQPGSRVIISDGYRQDRPATVVGSRREAILVRLDDQSDRLVATHDFRLMKVTNNE